jgi:hypothetical protein
VFIAVADQMRVIAANPALLPHLVAAFSETEQFLVGIVVQRTGLDPAADVLTHRSAIGTVALAGDIC